MFYSVRLLKSYMIWVQIGVSQIGLYLWWNLNIYLYERTILFLIIKLLKIILKSLNKYIKYIVYQFIVTLAECQSKCGKFRILINIW